jgi:hypothetical protein
MTKDKTYYLAKELLDIRYAKCNEMRLTGIAYGRSIDSKFCRRLPADGDHYHAAGRTHPACHCPRRARLTAAAATASFDPLENFPFLSPALFLFLCQRRDTPSNTKPLAALACTRLLP